MPSLYNCRHSGDLYRITKFNDDMNPEGSYLTDGHECDCPAGVRPTCRHRQMLPRFIDKGHVGDEWFFDYDRGGWVQMGPEWLPQAEPIGEVSPELDQTEEVTSPLAPIMTPESKPKHMKRRFL